MNRQQSNSLRIFLFSAIGMLLCCVCVIPGEAQQKVQFTQYMFNGLIINPAYAGADEALNLTFIQRKQWANIESSPSTQTLSAHTLFRKKNLGLGFTIINDKIGVHKSLSVLTNYAYHLHVGDNSYLSVGLLAGIHSRKSNYASLAGNTTIDPRLFDTAISYTAFDLGMGLYFRSSRLHVGLSAPEILPKHYALSDTVSVELKNINFFLFAKYLIPLSENIELEPSVLVKYLTGVPLSFDISMNVIYRKVLTLGMSYRKSESLDFMIKAQMTRQLQFGYSYDHPMGEVSRVSSGSHELMVSYVFKYAPTNVTSPR